jgi:hypothetical protein
MDAMARGQSIRLVRAATTLLCLVAYGPPAFAGAGCYPPYTYIEWLIQGAAPKPTYCGSVKKSRVASGDLFFGMGFVVHTISMADAQKLAGYPLYFPAPNPKLDYSKLYAGIQAPGDDNDGRGFVTKRRFTHGYFNYTIGYHEFHFLSAADAAVLGNDGIFHCEKLLETRTLSSSRPIEICTGSLARWWSPDGQAYIAAYQGGRPDDVVAIANSMTPLDEVTF